MTSITVIVIFHNDSLSVERCNTELSAALRGLGREVELIYVDNGSTDDTLFKLRQLLTEETDSLVRRVIALRQYTPVGDAFAAGIQHSQGQFVLTIDSVLSVDPIEISRLLDEIEQGYDVVLGWRRRQHLSALVRWRSSFLNFITSQLMGVYLHDYGTPLRAFRRDILKYVKFKGNLYPFAPVFAHTAGASIQEIQVIYRPDYYIRPEYTANGYISSFLSLIAARYISRHADEPFMFFGRVGFGLAGLGAILPIVARRDQKSWILSGLLLSTAAQWIMLGLGLEALSQDKVDTINHDVIGVFEKK